MSPPPYARIREDYIPVNIESEFKFQSPKTRTPRTNPLKASAAKSVDSKLPITLSTSKKRSIAFWGANEILGHRIAHDYS